MKMFDKLIVAVRGSKKELTSSERVVRAEKQRKEARLELEQAINNLALARARKNKQ